MSQHKMTWAFLDPVVGIEKMLEVHMPKIQRDLYAINPEAEYSAFQLIGDVGWSLDHDREVPQKLPQEFQEYFLFILSEIDYALNQFTGARHALELAKMDAEVIADHVLWLGQRNLPIRGNAYLAKKIAEILGRPEAETMQVFGVERIAENA